MVTLTISSPHKVETCAICATSLSGTPGLPYKSLQGANAYERDNSVRATTVAKEDHEELLSIINRTEHAGPTCLDCHAISST